MLKETGRLSNGTVSFDTQRVVDRLREGGWNEGQSRALCDVLREIMRGVATKADIKEVKAEMRTLEGQMTSLRLIMLTGFIFLGILIALENFL